MSFRFAIVGAGLTGTSMLYQFVQRLARGAESAMMDPSRVHIRVLEKQPVAGPGFPHNERFVQPYHITNMCAEEMGIVYSHPRDFSDWVESRRSDVDTRFRAVPSDPAYHRNDCSHYPRALMGEYLKARFADALKLAKHIGATVEVHTHCEVTDIVETERGLLLHARFSESGSLFRFLADRVLLATGHWPRRGSARGYFATPWPAHRLLERIPPGAEVAVIGSSLSAIETVLTLSSDGKFYRTESGNLVFIPPPRPRRLTLLSRHGLLPKVSNRAIEYQPRFFNRENLRDLLARHTGNLTLDAIFRLLDLELSTATGQAYGWEEVVSPKGSPVDALRTGLDQSHKPRDPQNGALWQSILRQAFPLARALYLALSIAERTRFDKNYATLFFAHAATQPRINAEKMLALMRVGIVNLVKLGQSYRFAEKSVRSDYEFVYGDKESRVACFRYVVDARGQERSVRSDASQLACNLIRRGSIHLGDIQTPPTAYAAGKSQEFPTDSVWIDPDSHRVMQISRTGTVTKSDKMFAVGAMTRGQIIDVSMARGLTRSTDRVAEQLVDWLARNH